MTPLRVKMMRKAWAKGDAKRDFGNVEPKDICQYKNILYSQVGSHMLFLDVYVPDGTDELLPTIVSIHGGGYFYGDKELYRFYCMELAQHGFAVVNFDYRLAPENHFPAPLEDTNSVMEWISAHGSDYFIDKTKVFMVGDSAGAQLVSHYGTIYSSTSFASLFEFKVPDINILGLSMACGMYDVKKRQLLQPDSKIMSDYLGKNTTIDDERLNDLPYIDGSFPPSFVFTSYYDFLKDECEPFYDLLNSKGIHTQMKCYGTEEDKELGHVFHVNVKLPTAHACNDAQCAFFKSLL